MVSTQRTRKYACQGVSNGELGQGRMRAHRRAFLAGEFDEPCDHGKCLLECSDPDCCDLYDRIVGSYLSIVRRGSSTRKDEGAVEHEMCSGLPSPAARSGRRDD